MKTRAHELQITIRADTDADMIEGLEILLRNLKIYGTRTHFSTGVYAADWKCKNTSRVIHPTAGQSRIERGELGE